MLLRRIPFAEWVVVYYDPEKTSVDKLLTNIRSDGCPRAKHVEQAGQMRVMNPYLSPGDTVQIRIDVTEKSSWQISGLPKGWAMTDALADLDVGEHFISLRTSPSARRKSYELDLQKVGGQSFPVKFELVSAVR